MLAAVRDLLPAGASVLRPAGEIDEIIERMAREIAVRLAGLDPIVMPILMGGAFTAIRLAAHFDFAYELDGVRLGRYGASREGGELVWRWGPSIDPAGRHVLVVDDVLDRGVTLAAVCEELGRLGAASIVTAVLIRKAMAAAAERPAVDVVGADAPDRFLFGCGMDLDGRWRGLPALFALDSTPSVAGGGHT